MAPSLLKNPLSPVLPPLAPSGQASRALLGSAFSQSPPSWGLQFKTEANLPGRGGSPRARPRRRWGSSMDSHIGSSFIRCDSSRGTAELVVQNATYGPGGHGASIGYTII